jgi:hypothetical protein
LPFEFDEAGWSITRVLAPGADRGAPVTVRITALDGALCVNTARRKHGKREVAEITRDLRRMFRLDDEMSVFYAASPSGATCRAVESIKIDDYGW